MNRIYFSSGLVTAVFCFLLLTQAAGAQENCDENKILSVDEVKRTAENSLINSSSVTKILPSGTEITVFYFENSIIKISSVTDTQQFEFIYFDKGNLCCYELSAVNINRDFHYIYYIEENRIFCKQSGYSGAVLKFSEKEQKNILDIVDEYLIAVQ